MDELLRISDAVLPAIRRRLSAVLFPAATPLLRLPRLTLDDDDAAASIAPNFTTISTFNYSFVGLTR